MSYFKKFKEEFFAKVVHSDISYEPDQLKNMVKCFNAAAKEILVIKQKEKVEGLSIPKSERTDGTMTPHQIANAIWDAKLEDR